MDGSGVRSASVETGAELIAALRRAGLRVTAPRRAICTVLSDPDHVHLSASDVQRLAQDALGGPIDLSTVYRTVDALQEAGVAHHVHLGQGASVIHLTGEGHHHHLVCEECGRTTDIPLDELGPLAELLDRHGYEPATVHFAIVSRCQSHQ